MKELDVINGWWAGREDDTFSIVAARFMTTTTTNYNYCDYH